MTVPNFMSKVFWYQDLSKGCGVGKKGMIRQKKPGQIGLSSLISFLDISTRTMTTFRQSTS